MTLLSQFQTVARQQPRNAAQLCSLGERIVEDGQLNAMSEETKWSFLEKLAIAAFDHGNMALAKVCVDRLDARFPNSSRVKPLQGMVFEAEGRYEMAAELYERELAEHESNVNVRKRLITLHLNAPYPNVSSLTKEKGIALLVQYLDHVYTDAEAWSELAEAYASLGMLQQSLSALGDLILIQPQNPISTLKYAETAYTLNDIELAYRYFLRTIELAGKDSIVDEGAGRRAAFGVKACIPKLKEGLPGIKTASDASPSGTAHPQHLAEVDVVITEQLIDAYSKEWEKPLDIVAPIEESKAFKGWLQTQNSSVQQSQPILY